MPAEAGQAVAHAPIDAARRFLSSFAHPAVLLVAISGGSDSKGLLVALHALLTSGEFSGFSLFACTVDHGLRPESADEARSVQAFCAARGIAHRTMTWGGEKPKAGLQDAARHARYKRLAAAAGQVGAACIVTGHTRDDQRETIAMRADRSLPGATGLSGMAQAVLFERSFWIVRPFLDIARSDIRRFLHAEGEGWIEDPSNADIRFERVRKRSTLAQGEAAAGETAPLATARSASSARVASLLLEHVSVFAGAVARVEPALFGALHDPDHRRAVLLIAAVIGGRSHPPGGETARRLSAFLADVGYGRMTAARTVFDKRKSGLYLYREARALPQCTVAAKQRVVWDDRVAVENARDEPVLIHAAGLFPASFAPALAGLIDAGVPQAVAKRAALSAGSISPVPGAGAANPTREIAMEVVIPSYDTFLPCFDLMIADTMAALLGRQPYPSPPIATF